MSSFEPSLDHAMGSAVPAAQSDPSVRACRIHRPDPVATAVGDPSADLAEGALNVEEGWGLEAVVPASTFEVGSVGPASGEDPHPAISIAIATAIAIRGGYERLGLILVLGRFLRSCTGTHLLSIRLRRMVR